MIEFPLNSERSEELPKSAAAGGRGGRSGNKLQNRASTSSAAKDGGKMTTAQA